MRYVNIYCKEKPRKKKEKKNKEVHSMKSNLKIDKKYYQTHTHVTAIKAANISMAFLKKINLKKKKEGNHPTTEASNKKNQVKTAAKTTVQENKEHTNIIQE